MNMPCAKSRTLPKGKQKEKDGEAEVTPKWPFPLQAGHWHGPASSRAAVRLFPCKVTLGEKAALQQALSMGMA